MPKVKIKVLPYSSKWEKKPQRKVHLGRQQKVLLVKDRMENYLINKSTCVPEYAEYAEYDEVNEIGRVWTF